MTAPLATYAPEDIETALVAWLTPLRRTAIERKAGDPLPFTLVNMVTGTEDSRIGVARQIVSVHTMTARPSNGSLTEIRDEAIKTHRRMLYLQQEPRIAIGARTIGILYVEVVEAPRAEFYSDNILRKVARYAIGLPYVAT